MRRRSHNHKSHPVLNRRETSKPSTNRQSNCNLRARAVHPTTLAGRNTRPESSHDRNRNRPRFSVANVPIASQTAEGTLFFPKTEQIALQSLAFSIARTRPSGGEDTSGVAKIAAIFYLRQKNRCGQEPLTGPFFNGVFSVGFSRGKTVQQETVRHSGKWPIKVGKRPIKEGKRPIKEGKRPMEANGLFSGTTPW